MTYEMPSSSFAESAVEGATLAWLVESGYAILRGPDIAVGKPAVERTAALEVSA